MKIIKRNGEAETVNFNKILTRVHKAAKGLTLSYKSLEELAQEAISFLAEGVTTAQIDETLANIAENWSTKEPNYEIVAKNIIVSRHHKEYEHNLDELYNQGLITQDLKTKWLEWELDEHVNLKLDFNFTFFGYTTLLQKYLLKYPNGAYAETPQHLYMRVAASLFDTKEEALQSYYYQSHHYYTHASPTLFHAGTPLGNLASCFLLGTDDDILGLFETVKECGNISKHAGGIGLHVTNVRARGSYIKGTGGHSNGLVPYLKVLEATANLCDQGGQRRKGAFSVYLEPWHADIEDFIAACKKTGEGRNRAKDLFYALWVPDEFMRAVKEDDYWHLFCPNEVPSLLHCHGNAWLKNYQEAVEKRQYRKKIRARDLMHQITMLMLEEGKLYFLYKDAANAISPQSPLGTINSSNLCVSPETLILTDKGHLPIGELENQWVKIWNGYEWSNVQIKKTGVGQQLVRVVTSSGQKLDCTPYHNFYVRNNYGQSIKTKAEDLKLGDRIPYCTTPSVHAWRITRVAEILYLPNPSDTYCFTEPKRGLGVFNGLITGQCAEVVLYSNKDTTAVCNLASMNLRYFNRPDFDAAVRFAVRSLDKVIDKNKYPDEKTKTSNMYLRPIGLGIQGLADYWMDEGIDWLSKDADVSMHKIMDLIQSSSYDESRKLGRELGVPEGCKQIGADRRNSVILALMPTASTSQILGNTESFEPQYQNIYRRRTGVDDFIQVNHRLVRELQQLGKWSPLVYSSIYQNNGSVQHLDIPEELKAKYRTVFEIGPKRLIELAAIRQAYIDQSQSMNLYYTNPNTTRVTKALMYAWELGLITGTYYTRTLSSGKAQVMETEDCDSCSG